MRKNSFASWLIVLLVGLVILVLQLLYRAGVCDLAARFNTDRLWPAFLLIGVSVFGLLFGRKK